MFSFVDRNHLQCQDLLVDAVSLHVYESIIHILVPKITDWRLKLQIRIWHHAKCSEGIREFTT